MDALKNLERQIREKLDTAEKRKREQQAKLQSEMEEKQRLTDKFSRIADRLVTTIIYPRVARVAVLFDNAHVQETDSVRPWHGVCVFEHTPMFPATTRLDLGICPDQEVQQVVAIYALEIVPVLFQFAGHDQKAFALDQLNEEEIAAWFDEHILRFVDTYLRVTEVDYYQQENMVTDPVCGMRLNKLFAPAQFEHQGKTYYFCVDDCRQEFAEAPTSYVGRKNI